MTRALPSVLNQTYQNMDIHIIGDGTEDATGHALVDTMFRDGRIRFTNLPHQQYSDKPRERWATIGLASLNYGLDHARGDWIAVLADDDAWTPDHNQVLLDAADRSGADHVYGISICPTTGQRWGEWPPGDGKLANGANLYKASLNYRYDQHCFIDRGLTGDADLWLRMINGGVRFFMVEQVVHYYFPSEEGKVAW